MRQLSYKWLAWTAPLGTNGSATSDKRENLVSDNDSSGTSGTPGSELYHVLLQATISHLKKREQ